MPIKLNLDRVMSEREISLTELADRIGLTLANLSILKTNKARAIRFTTLEALCRELRCQPGELLEFVPEQGELLPATKGTKSDSASKRAGREGS
jgi:putative transcriptional regulator